MAPKPAPSLMKSRRSIPSYPLVMRVSGKATSTAAPFVARKFVVRGIIRLKPLRTTGGILSGVMENREIARILHETAALLEIDGAIIGRYRTYEKAADLIASLPESVEQLAL